MFIKRSPHVYGELRRSSVPVPICAKLKLSCPVSILSICLISFIITPDNKADVLVLLGKSLTRRPWPLHTSELEYQTEHRLRVPYEVYKHPRTPNPEKDTSHLVDKCHVRGCNRYL